MFVEGDLRVLVDGCPIRVQGRGRHIDIHVRPLQVIPLLRRARTIRELIDRFKSILAVSGMTIKIKVCSVTCMRITQSMKKGLDHGTSE